MLLASPPGDRPGACCAPVRLAIRLLGSEISSRLAEERTRPLYTRRTHIYISIYIFSLHGARLSAAVEFFNGRTLSRARRVRVNVYARTRESEQVFVAMHRIFSSSTFNCRPYQLKAYRTLRWSHLFALS